MASVGAGTVGDRNIVSREKCKIVIARVHNVDAECRWTEDAVFLEPGERGATRE